MALKDFLQIVGFIKVGFNKKIKNKASPVIFFSNFAGDLTSV